MTTSSLLPHHFSMRGMMVVLTKLELLHVDLSIQTKTDTCTRKATTPNRNWALPVRSMASQKSTVYKWLHDNGASWWSRVRQWKFILRLVTNSYFTEFFEEIQCIGTYGKLAQSSSSIFGIWTSRSYTQAQIEPSHLVVWRAAQMENIKGHQHIIKIGSS